MADPMKDPKDDRMRRKPNAYDTARTGDDPSFVAVNTLPTKKATETTETRTTGTERMTDRPMTEKIKDTLSETKEKAKDVVEPDRPTTERTGMIPPARTTTTASTTRSADWDTIRNPSACGPEGEADYGTRPVSELSKPTEVKDKADLAAVRMMEREKADREKMDRERIMTTATMDAAAARAAMASKETTRTETTRIEPAAGERTIRQGAAIDTPSTRPATTEHLGTETVIPPTTTTHTTRITPAPSTTKETTTRVTPVPTPIPPPTTTVVPPVRTPTTMTERDRMHAEDPSVHPDWETQPQINAPRDVGIPTAEGQADAARLRAGERRSDVAKEPRIDRRGGEFDVPLASGARTRETTTRDDRSMTEKMRDAAHDTKEKTKETARDVKEDVDRKI